MPQIIVSGYLPAIVLTVKTLPDFETAKIDAGHIFVESCQPVIPVTPFFSEDGIVIESLLYNFLLVLPAD